MAPASKLLHAEGSLQAPGVPKELVPVVVIAGPGGRRRLAELERRVAASGRLEGLTDLNVQTFSNMFKGFKGL